MNAPTPTPTSRYWLRQASLATAAWLLTGALAGLPAPVLFGLPALALTLGAFTVALHSLWTDPHWDDHRPSMTDRDWDAFEAAARAEMDGWPCTCTHTAADHHHGTTPCVHCHCAIFEGVTDE